MSNLSDVFQGGLEYTRGKLDPAEVNQKNAKKFSSIQPAIPLKSDYLNCTSYFIQTNTGKIFGIDNTTGDFDKVTYNMEEHLKLLNNISRN
jgi:hypothetical protein